MNQEPIEILKSFNLDKELSSIDAMIVQAIETIETECFGEKELYKILKKLDFLMEKDVKEYISMFMSILPFNYLLVYEKKGKKVFIKTKDFFAGKQFNILPTANEIENNILFLGDRFIPFYNDTQIKKEEFIIKNKKTNKNFRRKKHRIQLLEASTYYALFGPIDIHDKFEKLTNKLISIDEISKNNNFFIELKPLNMKGFYNDNNFKLGDSIIVTCDDYDTGSFSFEYFSKEEKKKKVGAISSWISILDESALSFFDKIEDNPIEYSIYKMLTLSFFFAGNFLTKNPYISISTYLQKSDKVSLSDIHGIGCIWRKDESPLANLDLNQLVDERDCNPTSFIGMINYMGFDFSEGEIIAYCKNELYINNKKPDFMNVYNKCFDKRIDEYYDDLKEEFLDFLSDLFDEVKKDYNYFIDAKVGKIRIKILEAKEIHLKWMRNLDKRHIMPEDLPRKEILSLAQFTASLGQLLEELNNPDYPKKDLDELKVMSEHFSMIEVMILEIDEMIDEK